MRLQFVLAGLAREHDHEAQALLPQHRVDHRRGDLLLVAAQVHARAQAREGAGIRQRLAQIFFQISAFHRGHRAPIQAAMAASINESML